MRILIRIIALLALSLLLKLLDPAYPAHARDDGGTARDYGCEALPE